MIIKIPLELLKEILYFLNGWLRFMGFGGEYRRLSRLIWNLYKAHALDAADLRQFHSINSVIENFERIERIEDDR